MRPVTTAILAVGLALAAAAASATGGSYQLDLKSDIGVALSNAPANSWVKLNLNAFEDVWTPFDQRPRPADAPSAGSPHSIIAAWSSMAWDSNRGDLIFWGGGHANYPGNDVYRWRSETMRWERASLPSEVTTALNPAGLYEAVDGPFNAPPSAHTYDNSEFLPVSDRFITFGGAAFNTGRYFELQDGSRTGPYLWDPVKANPDAVGGTAGSNVNPQIYTNVEGGAMWENRNNLEPAYAGDLKPGYGGQDWINGTSAYATENGLDVLYLAASSRLFKYTLHDIADPGLDSYEEMGRYLDNPFSGEGTGAYDPVRNIFLRSAGQTLTYWSLDAPGIDNQNVIITPVVQGGTFNFLGLVNYGIDYDPIRQYFLLWNGEGELWRLQPPEDLSTGSWILSPIAPESSAAPDIASGHTGILGKWKYAAALDVFLGAFDSYEGQIWAYKPAGWQPQPIEEIPFISSPLAGSMFQSGDDVQITVDSLDQTISDLTLFADGVEIAQGYSVPFTATWYGPQAGEFALTVVATGEDGIERTSAAIQIKVCGSGFCTTQTLQDGVNGYDGTRDAYLYAFGPSANYGSLAYLLDRGSGTQARSLVQFQIFESEGGPIPDNATITSATLSVYKYSYYDHIYQLYPLLTPWVEDEASWVNSSSGVPWGSPGASGVGQDLSPEADALAETGWTPGWLDFEVSTGVSAIAQGRTNHGWILEPISGNSNFKYFRSREYDGDPSLRPRLTIQYDYPETFPDSDGDGVIDSEDAFPDDPNESEDTDGDGTGNNADMDDDNDNLLDTEEIALGTNPLVWDSDMDGASDGDEVLAGTDPLSDTSFPNASNGDLNVDGIVDIADVLLGQRILLGEAALTPEHLNHGDVAPLVGGVPAPNGLFNLGDLLLIEKKSLVLADF